MNRRPGPDPPGQIFKQPFYFTMQSARILFILFVTVAVGFEIFADVFFKRWTITNQRSLLIGGLIIYFIGTCFWAYSLKYGELSRAVAFFTILNMLAITAIGVFLFQEKLTNLNWLGIGLGILSIILLEL
jgi:multidrug transporter EmrE-like cation transporter